MTRAVCKSSSLLLAAVVSSLVLVIPDVWQEQCSLKTYFVLEMPQGHEKCS